MSAIITNKFRVRNASSFIGSTDNYYMFIGKTAAWDSEYSPDTPLDNVDTEAQIWDDMMSLKKIDASNMSHGVTKRMWTSGQFYDIYRHDYGTPGVFGLNINTGAQTTPTTLFDANYFVITADFSVWICVANPVKGASTVNPSTLTVNATTKLTTGSPDGYVWRQITVTSTSDVIEFSTTDFHPVKTLVAAPIVGDPYYNQWSLQDAGKSNAGAIFNVVINTAGSGYGANLSGNTTIATIVGDGSGATCSVDTNGSGAITAINITAVGSHYTWAKVVFGGTGTLATATAIMTPLNGLGADPVYDLCAANVIINTKFEYADGNVFTVQNDYRRVGLVINPLQLGTSSLLTTATASTMITIKVTGTVAYTPDMIVKDSTTNVYGRVVDVSAGTGPDTGMTIVRLIFGRTENSMAGAAGNAWFIEGNSLVSVTGGAVTGVMATVINSDVELYSGALCYFENRRPVMRSIDQVESISVVFEW